MKGIICDNKNIEEKDRTYIQKKLRCYQKKKDYFNYETFYANIMIITKQKSRADPQNMKKKTQNESEKHP